MSHDALEQVYLDYGTQLWRGVYAFSGGRRDIADDAVAEAFALAIEHSATIRASLPWLYRVAFRHAAKALRKERRNGDVPIGIEQADPPPEAGVGSIGALEILRPSQRAVVFLHYYADLSIADIARATGTTTVSVRVQLHRARQALRQMYMSAAAMRDGQLNRQGGDHCDRVA